MSTWRACSSFEAIAGGSARTAAAPPRKARTGKSASACRLRRCISGFLGRGTRGYLRQGRPTTCKFSAMRVPSGCRFWVVPHTHWDREWYLPLEHFRLELAALVDELIATRERDPRFRVFTLDGQAVLLEDYLELRPEQEPRLRALLADGRLAVGPSYVLPDELLVGGESLVRNLLLGRAVCERLGARASGVGYLPDSFGHPAQLPQILEGFGIESFLFSRGVGDEVDD